MIRLTLSTETVFIPSLSNQRFGFSQILLGIKVIQSSHRVVYHRKYVLDILEEAGTIDCKPTYHPMDPNIKVLPG